MILAQNNSTSASYWLSLPLSELGSWIADNNSIIAAKSKK